MADDRPVLIAPSVLPADFASARSVWPSRRPGVDRIQFDVMDGRFIPPNLTFGPDVIASLRPHVSVPFEAHLMVEQPDELASRYVEAGCERLIVHAEASPPPSHLGNIAELGAKAAVAVNPATPTSAFAHVLDLVDLVLIMTVNPGFGGQSYIETMEPKIAETPGDSCSSRGTTSTWRSTAVRSVHGGRGRHRRRRRARGRRHALYRDPEGLGHAVADLRAHAEAARA